MKHQKSDSGLNSQSNSKLDSESKSNPLLNDVVTLEKLDKYFLITGEALEMASKAPKLKGREAEASDFLDMASRYYEDAKYFKGKNDYVLAFAALDYAHGWLDAGARIKLFKVNDSRLFTVDEE